jgi:hypothetical protein
MFWEDSLKLQLIILDKQENYKGGNFNNQFPSVLDI